MSLFKNMNLARGIILVSVVGSLALGWFCWQRSQELDTLRSNLATRVEPTAQRLIASAHRHTQLSKGLKDDSLAGQADIESFVRKVAFMDKIKIGSVDFTRSKPERGKGIFDETLTIKSSDKGRAFPRLLIANFLYTLEFESKRVRVTKVDIDTSSKSLKPHEIPNDEWLFSAELTSRQRE